MDTPSLIDPATDTMVAFSAPWIVPKVTLSDFASCAWIECCDGLLGAGVIDAMLQHPKLAALDSVISHPELPAPKSAFVLGEDFLRDVKSCNVSGECHLIQTIMRSEQPQLQAMTSDDVANYLAKPMTH